ncbi:MAG: hypothetical protein ACI9XO_001782 [Paraglaciecola sp.]
MVIGILIALQINNWNASNKNQILTNSYLADLKGDLVVDIAVLKEGIGQNKFRVEYVDSIGKIVATRTELSK